MYYSNVTPTVEMKSRGKATRGKTLVFSKYLAEFPEKKACQVSIILVSQSSVGCNHVHNK